MTHPTDQAEKPSHDQIAIRAELLWKAKGNPQGQDDQIWLEAEQQLAQERHENEGNSAASQPSESSKPELPNSVAQEQMVEKGTPPKSASKSGGRKKSSGR